MFFEEPKRKPIRASVKKKVSERAKGRCEHPRCNQSLEWRNKGRGKIKGVFHHTRAPSISPTEKTVRFLCPNHHSLMHEYKTTKRESLFGYEKERKIIRKDVSKKPKKKVTAKKKRRKRREKGLFDLF